MCARVSVCLIVGNSLDRCGGPNDAINLYKLINLGIPEYRSCRQPSKNLALNSAVWTLNSATLTNNLFRLAVQNAFITRRFTGLTSGAVYLFSLDMEAKVNELTWAAAMVRFSNDAGLIDKIGIDPRPVKIMFGSKVYSSLDHITITIQTTSSEIVTFGNINFVKLQTGNLKSDECPYQSTPWA
jgi:hypothetical protein